MRAVSIPRFSALSPEWNVAPVGAVVSFPINVVINWFPNSEAAVGAGMMIFETVIVGVVAAIRPMDSDAAGLYADFLGGVLELAIFTVTTGTTMAWPPSRVAFFASAGGAVICLASILGLRCDRIDGWLMRVVSSRWDPTANMS